MNNLIILVSAVTLFFSIGGMAQAKNDKEKRLPPGLQKNVESGKRLPPGWEKKLKVGEILDEEVYDQGRVVVKNIDDGLVTISLEGKLIRVIENTREIVDILKSN